MNRKFLGAILLVLVVLGGFLYQIFIRNDGQPAADIFGRQAQIVSGYIGSEKSNLLDNPEIAAALRSIGGVRTDYHKAGSIEMLSMDLSGKDFLWPSSQIALELYKSRGGSGKSTLLLNSPIVFYSWDIVVEAMEKSGLAEKRGETYYVTDLPALVRMAMDGATWASMGLDKLYGKVNIIATDPNKSNSGSQYAGLLANIIAGDLVTEANLQQVLPSVKSYFDKLGLMEHSTGILFERYATQGVGSFPVIVGYENQIIEFALQNPAVWQKLKEKMRILYPLPTVWSSHPMIALTDKGSALIAAMSDPRFQTLAWKSHGFRSGIPGIENDPAIFGIAGLPQSIDQVMPMPAPGIMERLLAAIKGDNE